MLTNLSGQRAATNSFAHRFREISAAYSARQLLSLDSDVKSAVAGLLSGQFVTAWQDNTTDDSGGQITAVVTEIVRTTTGAGTGDFFQGDALRDIVDGLGGQDDLSGGGGNDDLNGGSGHDVLTGGDGDDLLNGGTENDTVYGGAGNDKFIVDNAADFVVELIGEGTVDRVYASVSNQLLAEAEVEILNTASNGGVGAINLVGNEFAQTIIGNAGANIINSLGGVDTMQGLGGNDKYYVDNSADVVVEAVGGGSDRAYASANYSLRSGVEVESLTTNDANATTALKLAGNAFANAIVGNSGDNLLNGAAGADTLTGWVGDDIFMFNSPLGGGNIDAITDFNVADDTIRLENAIFTAITGTGVLPRRSSSPTLRARRWMPPTASSTRPTPGG
jgi:Ca2+-binding RTX toxin-like protein